MAAIDASDLRVRMVDGDAFPLEERGRFVVRPVVGRLLAAVYRDTEKGEMITMSLLTRDDGRSLGLPDDALIRWALDNVAEHKVESLDVLKASEDCRVFAFQDEDSALSGRMLDLPSLLATVKDQLSADAADAAVLGPHGALVALPRQTLLMVFFVDGGDLMTGAATLAANAAINFDEDDDEAVSPWVYWVVGEEVEEMPYVVDDDGDVTEMGFPDALMALIPESEP